MTARVTVIVCHRHGRRIADTARSILASAATDVAVCLVDQRVGDQTGSALGDLPRDPRLHVLRGPAGGLAAGRNAGASWATSERLAFTDEDCVVTPTWVSEITEPFARDPRIGVVFGTVRPAPYDPAHGFLPSLARREPFLARSIGDARRLGGLGASMAVRRSVWEAVHGFDEMLGAGARLRAGEDTD
ncbi:MAG: glycosyltransferase family 2 protein, partial [Gammaproteobacteria bacterium]